MSKSWHHELEIANQMYGIETEIETEKRAGTEIEIERETEPGNEIERGNEIETRGNEAGAGAGAEVETEVHGINVILKQMS